MRVLKTLAVAGVAACGAVMGSIANAQIVDTWSYVITTEFKPNSGCFVTSLLYPAVGTQAGQGCTPSSPDPGAFGSVTPTTVTWGEPTLAFGGNGLQSSLVISQGPTGGTGTIDTTKPPFTTPDCAVPTCLPPGNEIGLAQLFTHNNNVVFSPTLDFVTVTTTLSLTPLIPAGGAPGTTPVTPGGPGSVDLNVNFKETINQLPCDPDGSPVCPDIFVAGQFNAANFFYDFDGAGPNPAQQYFVQVFPFLPGSTVELAPLSDAACAKAGVAPGCIGFITQENQANTIQFAFALTTEPFQNVPEPGTLALFAAALVGLGFAVRRKKA